MSGIAGYFGRRQDDGVLQTMLRKMALRAPGLEGYHRADPVFMAQRVTERTAATGDPATDADKKTVAVFSGKLCNRAEIRDKLEPRDAYRPSMDDAALTLELYKVYGTGCVSHMRGAFAFAVHDMARGLVFIARDHMGEKPLYYTTDSAGTFIFATEIKALLQHPSVSVTPDLLGVDAYLSLGYAPGPGGLFKGIYELKAGHRVILNQGLHALIEPYWQWESFAQHDAALKTDADFQERFDTLFDEAVALRKNACARTGVFARSSLESAAVLFSMNKSAQSPLNIYAPHDETAAVTDGLPPVADIANRLGAGILDVGGVAAGAEYLPQLIWALDQPVSDLGVLTRHMMARRAAADVDAVLTFTGADALFVSYPAQEMLLYATTFHKSRFTFFSRARKVVPVTLMTRMFGYNGAIGERTREKLFDILDSLRRDPLHAQFMAIFSQFDWRDKEPLYRKNMAQLMNTFCDMQKPQEGWNSIPMQLMAMQRDHWLPDAVLAPFDKLAGFSGLTGHLPFMDHKLFEFMLGIPLRLRRARGRRKSLLRGYVDRHMPGLVNPLPVKEVRKQQLIRKSQLETVLSTSAVKEMIDVCLSEGSVRRRELFNWPAVHHIASMAKTGEVIYQRQLLTLLTLELWFRIYVDNERGWAS